MSDYNNDHYRPRGSRGSGHFAWPTSRRGYAFRTSQHASVSSPDPIPVDLGEVIEIISNEKLTSTTSKQTCIRNVSCIASFNWMGGVETPTIVIPGAPPKWAPPRDNPKLKEDSGTYYRDINAAYLPQNPLQAATVAILANPTTGTRSTDLMACASTLRSLFQFTRGERKTFRIMAMAVGETVFFLRRENSPREVIPKVYGYGHSMPEAYTMWHADVKGSVSPQRIVKYNFAGMDCLVRYEPDGYLPNELPGELPASSLSTSSDIGTSADFDILAAMRRADVSTKLPERTNSGLRVQKAGFHVPQSATFELKTRTFKRNHEDFFSEFATRLWLTQTPHFVLAFHHSGCFDDIRIRDVRKEILAWESENQADIKKFAGLLELIMKRVRAKGVLELWRHEEGDLQLLTPQDELYGALPLELEDQWTGCDNGGVVV